MTDDLVKRLRDPNGLADSVLSENERKEAADRIEELEAAFANISREYDKRGDRIEELEAKLEAAIELLGDWRLVASGCLSVQAVINKHDTTLAEPKGGDQ